ncbi:MAG: CoA transferase [Chloroflexi bacterium]|nr:CoA transferase [Chloroflexota bacterium]
MEPKLFDGLRLLELTGLMGQQCGKLFADMGAGVVKLEPPGGAPSRRVGPFLDDVPHPERSLSFWHYNTNKRGVTLDITKPQGQELFLRLARQADVIVEDTAPGTLDSLELGYPQLAAFNASLVMVSITPFGQTGPWKDRKTSDLVNLALGGPLWSCGYDDHSIPPMRPYPDASYHLASHYAFIGAMAALVQRQSTGRGQHVDVSCHEACHDSTEGAMPIYYFNNMRVRRQTTAMPPPARPSPWCSPPATANTSSPAFQRNDGRGTGLWSGWRQKVWGRTCGTRNTGTRSPARRQRGS